MAISRMALEELLAKYAQMLVMRLAHASGAEEPEQVRSQMAALAGRFPGALRELDDLELAEIRRRIEMLEGALDVEHHVEPWMEAMALFHALARGALSAKRWLDGRRNIDDDVVRAFVQALPSLPFPEDARSWSEELASLASPPGGRLTEAVFVRLAVLLESTAGEARSLVFGAPRRRG